MRALRAKAANRVNNAYLHLCYDGKDEATKQAQEILMEAERFVLNGFGAPKSWVEFLGL